MNSSGPLGDTLGQLRRLVGGADSSDSQLLEHFLAQRDEEAFAELVRRHGRMVLGVARAIVRDSQDADDVFQATFLVLARKAATIARRESVGSWLCGVARRVALDARDRSRRRQRHERQVPVRTEPQGNSADLDDLRSLLAEELGRLPEKYRAPLLLCYFEGKTHEEAAAILRWPTGTVAGRLARARETLRGRLTRRGLATSTVLFGILEGGQLLAAVAPSLADTVASSALLFSEGGSLTPLVSSHVLSLVQGALRHMLLTKLKTVAALLLTLAVLGTGIGLAFSGPAAQPKAPPPAPRAEPAREADAPLAARNDRIGDPLPEGALQRLGSRRLRHSGFAITLLAIPGQDEGKLLSANKEGIGLWDAGSGQLVRWFDSKWEDISTGSNFRPLALTADHKTLVTFIQPARKVGIFDLAKGICRQELTLPEEANKGKPGKKITGLALSANGTMLATWVPWALQVWDVEKGVPVLNKATAGSPCLDASLSADGSILAASYQDKLRLYDVKKNEEIREFDLAFSYQTSYLLLSADGKQVIVGGRRKQGGGFLILGNVASGEVVRSVNVPTGNGVPRCVPSLDGKTLLHSTDGNLTLFETATLRELPLGVQPGPIQPMSAALSPDGRLVAVRTQEGPLLLIDTKTGMREKLANRTEDVAVGSPMIFSAAGNLLAYTTFNGLIRLCDLKGQLRHATTPGHTGPINRIVFRPDGRSLVAYNGMDGVSVWDLSGQELSRPRQFGLCWPAIVRPIERVALAADGKRLIAPSRERDRSAYRPTLYGSSLDLSLFDIQAGKTLLHLARGIDAFNDSAFSPDGRRLALSYMTFDNSGTAPRGGPVAVFRLPGLDGHIVVLDAVTLKVVRALSLPRGAERFDRAPGRNFLTFEQLQFSPDGKLLAGRLQCNKSTVYVWNVDTGKQLHVFNNGQPSYSYNFNQWDGVHDCRNRVSAFSPDSKLLALGEYVMPLLQKGKPVGGNFGGLPYGAG